MQYRNPSGPLDNFRAFLHRAGAPFTVSTIIVAGIFLFASFLSRAFYTFEGSFAFSPATAYTHIWSFFTYPLVQFPGAALTYLFSSAWLWFVGTSLERSWGTQRYAAFFLAMSALFAVSIMVGTWALRDPHGPVLWGLYPPLAGITVAWCSLMPEEAVCVWPITLRAKYIAIIVAMVVWFMAGPILGLFAELAPLCAYLYVRYGRDWGRISHQTQRDSRVIKIDFDKRGRERRTSLDGSPVRSPFDIAGRIRDMQERRRLEKLLRNSGIKDPDWIDEDHKFRS